MVGKIQLAIILLAFPAIYAEHEYCRLPNCPGRSHTLCKYPVAGPVPQCGDVLTTGLTFHEKAQVLNVYNAGRPTVTVYETEEDLLAPEPGEHHNRTIYYRMYWDIELEQIAQRWADQCINNEDDCRHVARFDVRQRVRFIRRTVEIPDILPTLNSWYDDDYTPRVDSLNFQGLSIRDAIRTASSLIANLMRQNENRIGCAAVRTYYDINNDVYLVCNYGTMPES